MMFDNLKKGCLEKVGMIGGMWLLGVALVGVGTVAALGKAVIEENTIALNVNSDTTIQLIEDVSEVKTMITEVRVTMFNEKILTLKKQSYKLASAPDDIKPMDVYAAVDFCESPLFSDYSDALTGSEQITATRACVEVKGWVLSNPG